jgi:hypothetical protein
MIDQLGGRKFVYALLVVVLAFVLVVVGKLTTDAFIGFAETMGGIYVIGNVAEAVTNKMVTKNA